MLAHAGSFGKDLLIPGSKCSVRMTRFDRARVGHPTTRLQILNVYHACIH
jgi:hypothetical protein